MGKSVSAICYQGDDLCLILHIQPKASRDAVVGLHNDALKIAITAPPTEGKANAHLQKYLATLFAVSKSQVMLTKGASTRRKQVLIIRPRRIPPELTALMGDIK